MACSKKNVARWKRIDFLSEEEEQRLRELVKITPGMSFYGNRARTSVMLPLELAEKIAELANQQELTVGQVVVDLLGRKL